MSNETPPALSDVGEDHPEDGPHFETLVSQEAEDAFEGVLVLVAVVVPAHRVHPDRLGLVTVLDCTR